MQDILGKDLNVDDLIIIIHLYNGSVGASKGKIVGFTPKGIMYDTHVEYTSQWSGTIFLWRSEWVKDYNENPSKKYTWKKEYDRTVPSRVIKMDWNT